MTSAGQAAECQKATIKGTNKRKTIVVPQPSSLFLRGGFIVLRQDTG